MQAHIQQWAIRLGEIFRKRYFTLATAESCTGGGFSAAVTEVPGSSAWFERGFVVYSNAAKVDLLGVSPLTLKKVGSVSQQVVEEMVAGALRNSEATHAVAITGVAGPDGGSIQKPVGTVWMACAARNKAAMSFLYTFSGDRQAVRTQSIQKLFENILAYIQEC